MAGFAGFLLAVSGLVLLVTCLNLGTLLLARGAVRRHEVGVRLALGAGRGAIFRQQLAESGLLAAAGAVLGTLAAGGLARLAETAELPVPVPIALDLAMDVRVLTFAVAVSVAATLLAGVAPGWQNSRVDVVGALKSRQRGGSSRGGRLRSVMVVGQIAVSVVLLVVRGLLVRGLTGAERAELGLDPDRVLAVNLNLDVRGLDPEAGRRLQRRVVTEVEAIPGVRRASFTDIVLLTLSNSTSLLFRDGAPVPPPEEAARLPRVNESAVDPGHFDVLGIPVLAGRDFDERDTAGNPPVVFVNQTLASRYWPGEDPVGKRLRRFVIGDGGHPVVEVVGLVQDSTYVTVGEEPRAFVYRPLAQRYDESATMLVATVTELSLAMEPVRQALARIDRELPIIDSRPLTELTGISLLPARVAASLLSLFGLVALALAATGLYGVVAFLSRQRAPELGIRLTLGARPTQILATVLVPSVRWVGWGLLVGVVVSLLRTRLIAGFLYGVSSAGPLTYALVALTLTSVALLAAYLPARRAAHQAPMTSLRTE